MFDRRVTVVSRHGTKDKARKAIAPAQVFFISLCVNRCRLSQNFFFIRTQFQPQAIHDSFCNLVLHGDDVFGGSINAIAPDNFAALAIEQLRVNPKMSAHGEKPGRQDRIDVQFASDVGGVDCLPLILRHY